MTMALAAASVIGIGGIGSALIGGNAAQNAAGAQAKTAQQGQLYQLAEWQQIQKLLAPFVQGGQNAFNMQGNLAGANGNSAQQAAINNVQNGPLFTGLNKLGQDAILQNAAATGGLRTGNTNAALAQFTPQLLNQLLQQQFSNLGSLSSLGENAASATGNYGQQAVGNMGNLLQQQGGANAIGAMAQGQTYNNMINSLTNALGAYKANGGNFQNPFGGGWTTNVF